MPEMKKPQKSGDVLALMQKPSMLAQLRHALPKHVTAERLSRIVMTELRRTPKLLECERKSLLGAILQCAQLGLEPGVLGQAWLVPYGNEVQLIVGYRGMAQLGWRSGQISSINARAVYTADHFVYDFGSDKLEHRPFDEDEDPDALTHAYAIIHTTMGGRLWDVMSRKQIEKVRARSAAGKSGPWKTDYAEMCKKTVLRRLFKIAPQSAEMQRAMQLDDAADTGDSQGLGVDIELDGEVVADGALGEVSDDPIDTAGDEGPEALLHLDAAITARGEEFERPAVAREQIKAALVREFGKLSDLRGARLQQAIKAASIVAVSVK